MTSRNRRNNHGETSFSASQFREAMGPGYQVATFREQPSITGNKPLVDPRRVPARAYLSPIGNRRLVQAPVSPLQNRRKWSPLHLVAMVRRLLAAFAWA